jgi:subtilisin family serine protease
VLSQREAQPKPPDITLPPSLEDWAESYPRLADILRNSELGSVYKEFLVKYEEEGEEAALDLARQRGIVVTDEGTEYVYLILILDTQDNSEVVTEVGKYGGKVFSAYEDRVSVGVPVDMVRQQLTTEDPGAIFEDMTGFDHVIAVRLPEPMIPDGSVIQGEGVDVIGAGTWHDAGITGAGIKVGIIDGGFEGYESLLGEELPDNVVYQRFGPEPDPDIPISHKIHGTACAEIVHELAPDAELYFAEFRSTYGWVDAIEWLIDQDVDIISHSVSWIAGPIDGTGLHTEVADNVVSTHGVLWVNSAGNYAMAHYRAAFTDEDGDGLHDFAPGENLMAVYNNGSVLVYLQWDDVWGGATQDYNLYLYDQAGNLIESKGVDVQSGEPGHIPIEWVEAVTGGDTVYIAIQAYAVDRPGIVDILAPNSTVGYPDGQASIRSPADGFHILAVGAAEWDDDSLAWYSSQGPTDDGRLKPEISAPTDVSNASYGTLNDTFGGTSAACPHVAGTAALVWQAYPDLTPHEVMEYLMAEAVDRGPDGPDTGYGYGRLQLPPMAVEIAPPTSTPPSGPTPTAGPAPTLTPLPKPTVGSYAIPTSVPAPHAEAGAGAGVMLAGAVVLVAGLGCGGMALLFAGGIGLIVLAGRKPRPQPVPYPPRPVPHPPPPPPPQPQLPRCQYCGSVVRAGARFCPECGRPIE